MNTDQRFEQMWQDYLENNISPADFAYFMQCVKGGQYDEAIKAKIDILFSGDGDYLELSPQRVQQIMINIQMVEEQTSQLIRVSHSSTRIEYWAAAACFLVVLGMSAWFFGSKRAAPAPIAKVISTVDNHVSRPKGKKFIKLPDGSFVILNENSELDYPDTFKGKNREVTLRGEAYFDIKHLSGSLFVVHTGKISTVVMGTAFNINAYPGQDKITVTVTRGKVMVGDENRNYAVLIPNQQLSVNTGTNVFSEVPVDAESVVAWKSACLVLSDITIEDAALLIGNKYHVKITISDEQIRKCKINATFLDQESLDQVLKVICGIVGSSYVQQPNDQIIIDGISH
jgi:transmembrane sensor